TSCTLTYRAVPLSGTVVGKPACPATLALATTARLLSSSSTLKLLRRSPQQSVRFQTSTLCTDCRLPRSTCHQAWASKPVWVTDPWAKLPSVLPSTALLGGPPKPGSLDCVADLLRARLVRAEGMPHTFTSASER